ncbi:Long-chain fatty acid transport protein [Paracoccus halophilus]|uniref:Aromatic hydrocarbon degradation protein n=1 Tax=Paracoccus halophilus TaxID=376733 RepID=A0A099F7W9_9RHOB|nr:outer membrane protein transport protein [Paracoccus halophilus]KGJ06805.1 aromatic hydrocarbon degradation protein [Paracoccus halophilus]SFA41464.1 Long-chain fatty acid transport protein [Paracoccus halophilus]
MKKVVTGVGLMLAGTAPAFAGGIERAPQSLAPLFEKGNYAEISFGAVDPDVSGRDVAPAAIGGPFSTGDVAQGYGFFGLAYKHQFNENLSGALIIEQPFGADVRYDQAPEGSPVVGGTRVRVDSTTYTALLRYKFDNNFSVHGGVRGSYADGRVQLQGAGYATTSGYDLDIDGTWGFGWVAGVAYEVPDIAARISLTYNSPIEHDFDMSETGGPLPIEFTGEYEVKTPRSWTLEGQTGVAKDTLVFGSIRWVNWSEFKVDNFLFPIASPAGEIPLVEVKDTTTYTLGLGRKFTEQWSGSVSFLYEESRGSTVSPLAPVNGRKGVTLAAIYTMDNLKVTTGVNYTKLGDADLGVGASGAKREVAKMDDSEAWGIGVRLGYSF